MQTFDLVCDIFISTKFHDSVMNIF